MLQSIVGPCKPKIWILNPISGISFKFESRISACLKNESQKSGMKFESQKYEKNFESGILSNLKFESRISPFWNFNLESAVRLKFEIESGIPGLPLQGPHRHSVARVGFKPMTSRSTSNFAKSSWVSNCNQGQVSLLNTWIVRTA